MHVSVSTGDPSNTIAAKVAINALVGASARFLIRNHRLPLGFDTWRQPLFSLRIGSARHGRRCAA
jgi:hypothetical protein